MDRTVYAVPGSGRLNETAYQHVRRGILSGEYAVGSIMVDNDLAVQLGMSATPVSQALQRLDCEGLVERGARMQFVVRAVSVEARREVIELREALEGIALTHACRTMVIEEVDDLRLSLIRQQRAAQAGDEEAFLELDEEFHLIIARSTRLVTLERFIGQLVALARLMGKGKPLSATDFDRLLGEHTAIADALEARDETAMLRTLAEHLGDAAESPHHVVAGKQRSRLAPDPLARASRARR